MRNTCKKTSEQGGNTKKNDIEPTNDSIDRTTYPEKNIMDTSKKSR
jgi:hypothetical protein